MHTLSQTQHELVFKNQPPLWGGCQKRTFGNLIPGLFGNYLIYYEGLPKQSG